MKYKTTPESLPGDSLALALARLGGALDGAKS
jgi:hypothetical protein